MADLFVPQGRRVIAFFKDLGNGAHAESVYSALGETDVDDLLIPEGRPLMGEQPVVRYKSLGNGAYARTVYLTDGSEGAPASEDIVAKHGDVNILYKAMGDGTHAEMVYSPPDNDTNPGDRLVPHGRPIGGVTPVVRYRDLGNNIHARVVVLSDGTESAPTVDDILVPNGRAYSMYRDMGDGSFAEVLFSTDGVITPPPDEVVNNGLMLDGRYMLLNGNYLVLS